MKVKILNFEINDKREDYSTGRVDYYFTARVKVKHKKYLFHFMTLKKYVCAYLQEEWTDIVPDNTEIREAIHIKVYGELMKTIAQWKMQETLYTEKREREEEEWRRQEEERKKKIALGEQITIEKYLLNVNG